VIADELLTVRPNGVVFANAILSTLFIKKIEKIIERLNTTSQNMRICSVGIKFSYLKSLFNPSLIENDLVYC